MLIIPHTFTQLSSLPFGKVIFCLSARARFTRSHLILNGLKIERVRYTMTIWVVLFLAIGLVGNVDTDDVEQENDSDFQDCANQNAPINHVVCHYGGFMSSDKIDPCLCTHLLLTDWKVGPDLRQLYHRQFRDLDFIKVLKRRNPNIQIGLVLTGSSNDSIWAELTDVQHEAVSFAERAVTFLSELGLDGLAIEWDPPSQEKRENFTNLVNVFRNALDSESNSNISRWLMVNIGRGIRHGYDFARLSQSVDLFYLPAYNFTDDQENIVHPSPLLGPDGRNADALVDLVVSLNATVKKVILGIPAYGMFYQLNKSDTDGATFKGPMKIIPYQQICSAVKSDEWTIEREEDKTEPSAHDGESWIGYDDPDSVRIKSKYALLRRLAGVGIWRLDHDDFDGKCDGRKFPLVHAARSILEELDNADQIRVMRSLEEDIEASSSDADVVEVTQGPRSGRSNGSPFRVTQIVDRNGDIHIIENPSQTNMECTRPGYYRNPDDCTHFYRCVKFNQFRDNFVIFEYDCPNGLVFDERWEVCSWASTTAACGGSTEIQPVPRNKFICSSEGYFTDPENCRWFYKCSDFLRDGSGLTAFEFRCPFDLAFDESKIMCNWRWLVPGCGDSGHDRRPIGPFRPGHSLDGGTKPEQSLTPPTPRPEPQFTDRFYPNGPAGPDGPFPDGPAGPDGPFPNGPAGPNGPFPGDEDYPGSVGSLSPGSTRGPIPSGTRRPFSPGTRGPFPPDTRAPFPPDTRGPTGPGFTDSSRGPFNPDTRGPIGPGSTGSSRGPIGPGSTGSSRGPIGPGSTGSSRGPIGPVSTGSSRGPIIPDTRGPFHHDATGPNGPGFTDSSRGPFNPDTRGPIGPGFTDSSRGPFNPDTRGPIGPGSTTSSFIPDTSRGPVGQASTRKPFIPGSSGGSIGPGSTSGSFGPGSSDDSFGGGGPGDWSGRTFGPGNTNGPIHPGKPGGPFTPDGEIKSTRRPNKFSEDDGPFGPGSFTTPHSFQSGSSWPQGPGSTQKPNIIIPSSPLGPENTQSGHGSTWPVGSGDASPGKDWNRPAGPGTNWNRPTGPGTNLNRPTGPDTDWNRPTGPDTDWNRPTGPDTDWNRPTGPDTDWNRPSGPDTDLTRPSGSDTDWNRPTGPWTSSPSKPPHGPSGQTKPHVSQGTSRPFTPSLDQSPPSSSHWRPGTVTPPANDISPPDGSLSGREWPDNGSWQPNFEQPTRRPNTIDSLPVGYIPGRIVGNTKCETEFHVDGDGQKYGSIQVKGEGVRNEFGHKAGQNSGHEETSGNVRNRKFKDGENSNKGRGSRHFTKTYDINSSGNEFKADSNTGSGITSGRDWTPANDIGHSVTPHSTSTIKSISLSEANAKQRLVNRGQRTETNDQSLTNGGSIDEFNNSGRPSNAFTGGPVVVTKGLRDPAVSGLGGNAVVEEKLSVRWRNITELVGPVQCNRGGLFRHPDDCSLFYECFWDRWLGEFTVHYFECPVRLAFDFRIIGCNWPLRGPYCEHDQN